jgi:hypothetical protein
MPARRKPKEIDGKVSSLVPKMGLGELPDQDSGDHQTGSLYSMALRHHWDIPTEAAEQALGVVKRLMAKGKPDRTQGIGVRLLNQLRATSLEAINTAVRVQTADRLAGDLDQQTAFLRDLALAEEQDLKRVQNQLQIGAKLTAEDESLLQWLEADILSRQAMGEELSSDEEDVLRQREARLQPRPTEPRMETVAREPPPCGSPSRSPRMSHDATIGDQADDLAFLPAGVQAGARRPESTLHSSPMGKAPFPSGAAALWEARALVVSLGQRLRAVVSEEETLSKALFLH